MTDTNISRFTNGLARITHLFDTRTGRIVYVNKKGELVWNEKFDLTIQD